MRKALQRLEFSWKRPRRSLPENPDYEQRIAKIDQAIAEAGPGTTTELRRFPPLQRAWMPHGKQRSLRVPEKNDKFAFY